MLPLPEEPSRRKLANSLKHNICRVKMCVSYVAKKTMEDWITSIQYGNFNPVKLKQSQSFKVVVLSYLGTEHVDNQWLKILYGSLP